MALPARLAWCPSASVLFPPSNDLSARFEMEESFDPVRHATLNTSRWQNIPPIALVISHMNPAFVGTLVLNGSASGTLYEALPYDGERREVGKFTMTILQTCLEFDGTGSELKVKGLFGSHTPSIRNAGHGRKKREERRAFWAFRADLSVTVKDSSLPLLDVSPLDVFSLEDVGPCVFPDLLEAEGDVVDFSAGEDLQTLLLSLVPPHSPTTHDASFTFQTVEFVWESNRQRSRDESKSKKVQGGANAPY